MSLGRKMQRLRVQKGLTQQQISEMLHVSRSCYANYEIMKRIPPYPLIILLADYYHVSVDYLIRDDDKVPPDVTSGKNRR